MSDQQNDNLNQPTGTTDQPADTDSEQTGEQAQPAAEGTGIAAPGPHPHEAADIRQQAGNVARWPDPLEGFRDTDEPKGGVTPQ
jgi:hypothetical protein